MRKIGDIREYKNTLRQKYKSMRLNMPKVQKTAADKRICKRITDLFSYRSCQTVFCYVSTPIEVDTREFINRALKDGKTVAVPRCVPGTRQMEFYKIDSLDDLKPGSFSVDEPMPDKDKLITDTENSICIVPGLCFDKNGYRLGYGKGYYDRFLSDFKGNIVGICYSECIVNSLITGRFDRKCNLILTEKGVISTKFKHKRTIEKNR